MGSFLLPRVRRSLCSLLEFRNGELSKVDASTIRFERGSLSMGLTGIWKSRVISESVSTRHFSFSFQKRSFLRLLI